jgi:light-independent protochlorophyllide reductase subunit B
MEDHLLEIFGGHDTKEVIHKGISADSDMDWDKEAKELLQKVPGFVRGKVKRNTEKFARDRNIALITLEVFYAAKEAVGAQYQHSCQHFHESAIAPAISPDAFG